MSEQLQEYFDSRGVAVVADRGCSVIRGVKILGLESKNGRSYAPGALAGAVGLYEGAKVNVNHPKGSPLSPRDYQDRIGSIRDVRLRKGAGLFGDLHFNPKHALAEQLVWDAEHAPENVGFSHNVEARTSRQGERTIVEAILKVQSVDLVADPATTRGLFEAADKSAATHGASLLLDEITLQQLCDLRPDLVEAVRAGQLAGRSELESELEQLRAQVAIHKRGAAVRRLLREFGLPDPDSGDRLARQITSEEFVKSLMAAADEDTVRKIIEERSRLIEHTRSATWTRGSAFPQALAREQTLAESAGHSPANGSDFAQAIRGRHTVAG